MNNTVEEAKKRLLELSSDEWKKIFSDLRQNPTYKSRQTRKNVFLILDQLGLSLPETRETSNILLEEFQREEFLETGEHLASDRFFALATTQGDWFEELQETAANNERDRSLQG